MVITDDEIICMRTDDTNINHISCAISKKKFWQKLLMEVQAVSLCVSWYFIEHVYNSLNWLALMQGLSQ